jgi:predicted Zn finger-like uncharacterized protein
MKIECPHCHKRYRIKDEKLPMGKKVAFPCPACKSPIDLDLRLSPAPGAMPAEAAAADPEAAGRLKTELLHQWEDLPPMLEVLIKTRRILDDPKASLKKAAGVIEADPALAATILKIANSAFYGLSGNVSSVQHAAVVLGRKALEEVVTMAGASDFLGKELPGYGLAAGNLWRHSLMVAIASRQLALKKMPKLENDAFSAGLFHDLGRIILDPHILLEKEQLERRVNEGGRNPVVAEKEVFGFDHADLTADLCENWNFPPAQVLAIKHHHAPAASGGDMLAHIIHVVDTADMAADPEEEPDAGTPMMEEGALSVVNIDGKELAELMQEAAESVDQVTGAVLSAE